ncbi:MAG: serine hydrolase [Chitinophagaceae bacterium]|nr:serine hydrolase [Chitinophagaceae bacterium]
MIRILLLYVVLGCLAVSMALAQTDFTSQLDQLITESAAIDMFSGNVLVAENGKVIYRKSQGYADWEHKIAFNDSSKFNIGSIGKDFTQVVIAQLSQEGKLEMDDKLSKYLALFPATISDKITIRMLLRHEAGLGDYHPAIVHSIADRLHIISSQPLLFEPGTDRSYSNSGYVVLAAIIEKITGLSFDQNVQDRIFNKLNMRHSIPYYPGMKLENCANGTNVSPNGKKATEHVVNDGFTPSGDGGQYSTTADLLKFYWSLSADNRLLNDSHRLLFFTDFSAKPDFTLSEILTNEKAEFGFAGGLPGWNADVELFPGLNYIVIALSNFSDIDRPAEELCLRIGQVIRGKRYDKPRIPRFRFAYNQLSSLGAGPFILSANELLEQNGYETIQGPFFYNQLGYTLLGEKRIDEALVLFNHNTKLFPQNANAFDSLGEAYLLKGDTANAKINYAKSVALNPDNEQGRQVLEQLK